jgi:hypothetical protein
VTVSEKSDLESLPLSKSPIALGPMEFSVWAQPIATLALIAVLFHSYGTAHPNKWRYVLLCDWFLYLSTAS